MTHFKIADRTIALELPTYFIAEIAANHDGDFERAKKLIRLAKEVGAEAAKFQNFRAKQIVSDYGFRTLGGQVSHQAKWTKPVVEVYEAASVSFDWTRPLKEYCDEIGLHYFSSPYDFGAIDHLVPYVPAMKIGSGEITWTEALEFIAKKELPVMLATGASDLGDVQRAMDVLRRHAKQICLMQCNTNYEGVPANFEHTHLNVLRTYALLYPDVVLGLSDHTSGHATCLGAVALGARVIEKHFTDDTKRPGPDHAFAMDPDAFQEMVVRTRELERALGSTEKFVCPNEKETVIVQRRCLRYARAMKAGETITRDAIDVLRPATPGAVMPYDLDAVIGSRVRDDAPAGREIRWTDFDPIER